MKSSTLFLSLLILTTVITASGQRRTVTNADLEKYRQARLAAERDYRENYANLGLPSPEELAKRNEESRKELSELSARLRADELEREQISRQTSLKVPSTVYVNDFSAASRTGLGIAPAVVFGYGHYGPKHWVPFGRRQVEEQQYYVSGGSIWPVGPRTTPRPLFRSRRR